MKTLFINVSIRPDSPWKQLPVGLAYVLTVVKAAGLKFDLLDVDILGLTNQQVESYLAQNQYDVIAVGTIVTHYKWIKWLLHAIRAHQPHAKIIVGNSVGESIPEILFAKTPVDIVVHGEGEITVVELLRALEQGLPLGQAKLPLKPVPHTNGDYPATIEGEGISGIVFRDEDGRVVNNGLRKALLHIDELPYPDWELFEIEKYLASSRHAIRGKVTRYAPEETVVMPISTARGCVFKCSFCHYTQWNDPYRHRSPASVIGEIKLNMKKYGANYFNFWDDLSFHKLGPTEKFLDALLAENLDRFHFTAAIRSDLFGRDEIPYEDRLRVATKLRDAGSIMVAYSLESANDEILRAMNKRVKAEYFQNQITLLNKVGGVGTLTSLVFGYPQETPETIAESMNACLKAGVYPSPGFLLPLPKTEMWRYAVEGGYIRDCDEFLTNLTERQDIVINLTKMSNDQFYGEVVRWLETLNQHLNVGLEKNRLIRTGGFQKHGQNQVKGAKPHTALNPDMNYATVAGGV